MFLCLCTARIRQRAGLSKFGSFQNTSACFWSPRRKQKLWGWDASMSSGGNPLPSAGLPRPRHAEPRWGPHQKVCCCSSCISVCLTVPLSVCLCVCTRTSFSLIAFLKSHMGECGPPAWTSSVAVTRQDILLLLNWMYETMGVTCESFRSGLPLALFPKIQTFPSDKKKEKASKSGFWPKARDLNFFEVIIHLRL